MNLATQGFTFGLFCQFEREKLKTIKILVIEDDDVDFLQIKKSFKEANVLNEIIRAVDGVEAKQKLENGEIPDGTIALLDLNMPRMNGSEFLEWLRSEKSPTKFRKMPVIVLTTSDDPSDVNDVYSKWASGYIVKPLDNREFVKMAAITNKYWSLCEIPRG